MRVQGPSPDRLRRSGRVSAEDMPWDPELQVHLETPDGVFVGRCENLETSLHELLVAVEFSSGRAPVLRVGETTELEFSGGGIGSLMRAEVRTVLRTDEAARRCYCFRGKLTESASLYLVNRRRSTRVRPLASQPVSVKILELGEGSPEVVLHDISATGVSILVEPAIEEQLYTHERLRLAVRLPGEEKAIEIGTAIRHRRLVGSDILYGLEVDGQIPDLLRANNRFLVYLSNLRGQQPSC